MAGRRKPITFIETEKGCHICTSHHINKDGYPCIWKDGRNQNMHRVLYEEKNGLLPKGHVARHSCDNPPCINMDHIVGGTALQNTQDRVERGRGRAPTREDNRSDTKLTFGQIDQIRADYQSSNKPSQTYLSKKYNVHQGTISKIVNFKGKYSRSQKCK